MNKNKVIFLTLLSTLSSTFAVDITDNTTLHGFGTIGGSYNTNEHFMYRENVFSEVGSQDDFSFATHSKLGLQLDTNINDKLKTTIQGVTYQKEKGKLETDLDWAYLKYSPTDSLNFKIGRMRVPFFISSDSSNINYTNVWTHIPKETVIASVPFASYNGLEAEYLLNLGEHNISLQSYLGQEEGTINSHVRMIDAEIKDVYGFSITDYYGDLKLRGSYFRGDVRFIIDELNKAITQAEMLGISNAKSYSLDDLDLEFYALGFNYQINNIFLASEYTSVELDNKFIDDLRGWYVSTGYQFDKVMPYITYGASKQKDGTSITDIPILPPMFGGSALRDGFSEVGKGFLYAQESISLGVRYDIYKNMALKTQVDRIYYDENHRTMYFRDDKDESKGHLDVFSITLDFVF